MGQGQSRNLFEAAASDELERARYFIDHDSADVNGKDKDGWTPMHFASYGGSIKVANELLRLGADARAADKGGRTPLHLAALQGHMQLVKLLEAARADVNARDEHGMTPLHKAAVQGHTETASELLSHGAHVDAKLTDGSTALHLASWKGKLDVVKLLISRGANYRAVKNDGQTALHEAAEAGQTETVQYLLSIGANAQAQDEDGATPAVLASKAGHHDLASMIVAGGNAAAPARATSAAQDSVFYSYDQLQGQCAAPSAPPLPTASPAQGGTPPGPPRSDADFWKRALNTPIETVPGRMGGHVNYPDVYKPTGSPAAYAAAAPYEKSALATAPAPQVQSVGVHNSDWWRSHVGQDLSSSFPVPEQPAVVPEAWRQKKETAEGKHEERPNPRKEFEANVLRQAQGLWHALQGKPKDEAAARAAAQREAREEAEAQAEWAGVGAKTAWDGRPENVPRTEKYDLKPYEPEDDDEYRTDAERAAAEPAATAPTSGAAPKSGTAAAQVKRRLAELELDMDRQQGWIRGGSKADAKAYTQQKDRMRQQEAEIAALKRQLESMQIAASHARAGGAGRRHMDGSVPAEYICPITQEVMEEPVLAADGFSYERSAILQWLQLGHTTSPMTNQPLEHPGLTSNRALRAAIQQWKSQ
ncbi:g7003 [Coccomyxa elongata]